jgi:signal transduction histidine kinase
MLADSTSAAATIAGLRHVPAGSSQTKLPPFRRTRKRVSLQRVSLSSTSSSRRLDEQVPGSGLGLPIVRDLVELYGGRIRLENRENGGLRATLELPRAPVPA